MAGYPSETRKTPDGLKGKGRPAHTSIERKTALETAKLGTVSSHDLINELRDRGYKGLIYQTHGAASMDFIRIAGKAAEGVLMASGPVMDPEDQPDSALTKKPGLALNTAYEAKYGPTSRSQFAGHSYDAFLVLQRIIPAALKTAKPGTPEFREALRQALLTERDIAASQGVYNFTEKDRYGLDDRSHILLTVQDGKFILVK